MNPKTLKIGILVLVLGAAAAIIVLGDKDAPPPPCNCVPPLSPQAGVPGDMSSVGNDPVSAQRLPRMIDLGRGTCIPCKAMAPILKELKEEYKGRADIEFIDVGENPEQAQKYQIRLIPTQVFFDAEGKEVWRHEGFLGKEDIAKKLAEMGVK
jgi:thioredoxin 1